MECPYLEEEITESRCNASVTNLVPSVEEKVSYCTTEDHYRCPMLLAHVLRGEKRMRLSA